MSWSLSHALQCDVEKNILRSGSQRWYWRFWQRILHLFARAFSRPRPLFSRCHMQVLHVLKRANIKVLPWTLRVPFFYSCCRAWSEVYISSFVSLNQGKRANSYLGESASRGEDTMEQTHCCCFTFFFRKMSEEIIPTFLMLWRPGKESRMWLLASLKLKSTPKRKKMVQKTFARLWSQISPVCDTESGRVSRREGYDRFISAYCVGLTSCVPQVGCKLRFHWHFSSFNKLYLFTTSWFAGQGSFKLGPNLLGLSALFTRCQVVLEQTVKPSDKTFLCLTPLLHPCLSPPSPPVKSQVKMLPREMSPPSDLSP